MASKTADAKETSKTGSEAPKEAPAGEQDSKQSSGPSHEAPAKQEAVSEEEAASQQHHDAEKANANDESLTTILDVRQRTQLTILLAAATATMREAIAATFDASIPGSEGTDAKPASPRDKKKPLTEDEKMMAVDPTTADVAQYDRERRLLAAREKELSAPKMRELRDNALEWFDAWRIGAMGRVGEAVNSDSKEAAAKAEREGEQHKAEVAKGPKEERKVEDEAAPTDTKGAAEAEEDALRQLYPPIDTPLARLDQSKRRLILHSVLLLLLSLEHYPAPSRILLLYLTTSLRLPFSAFAQDEARTAQGLLEAANELSGDEETQRKAAENEKTRKWKVRLATAAGAAVVGVTGGLAAPLMAAGVGSVMGSLGLGATAAAGYLGTVAGSTMVVGGLFGAYGGRMTGQMMDHYAREVEDFAFVPMRADCDDRALPEKPGQGDDEAGKAQPGDRRLRVTIGISGWLTEKEDIVRPWRVLGHGSTEVFALRWELESLMNLGHAIETMMSSAAWGYAQREIIKRSIFADMMAAMWPLGLLQVSRVVDNPFSIAKSRAEKAGAVLADALINRAQGERPVTLLGYSLGARVIYSCLLSLAARRAFGLVENVVLMGAPVPSDAADWRVLRAAVTGRLANVYSANDYVLGFLYRTSSVQLGVAGLQRVDGVPGVENVDVSAAISGHLRYRHLVGRILRTVGFEDLDLEAVQREEEAFQKMLEHEEAQRKQVTDKIPKNIPKGLPTSMYGKSDAKAAEGDAKANADPTKATKEQPSAPEGAESEGLSEADAEKEAQSMEKSVQEKTRTSLMSYATELLKLGYPSNIKSAASTAASTAGDATGSTNPSGATEGAKDPAKGGCETAEIASDPSKADPATSTTDKAASYASYAVKYQPYVSAANTYARQHWPFSTNSSKAPEQATQEGGEAGEKATAAVSPETKEETKPPPDEGRSYLEMASGSWKGWGSSGGGGKTASGGESGAAAKGQSYLSMAGQYLPGRGKPEAKGEDAKASKDEPKEKAGAAS